MVRTAHFFGGPIDGQVRELERASWSVLVPMCEPIRVSARAEQAVQPAIVKTAQYLRKGVENDRVFGWYVRYEYEAD